MPKQTQCKQCGTCCRKGGPALRREDIILVESGCPSQSQLITIRRGELAINPVSDRLEAVPVELVKIRGRAGGWTCLFFDEQANGCTIYSQRPKACRLLMCWEPESILKELYKDTITRKDLIKVGDPILSYIDRHEEECPAGTFARLICEYEEANGRSEEIMAELTQLIRKDIALRTENVERFHITVALEGFLFGRPFFTHLTGSGLVCFESEGKLHLRRQ
jgi:Fe-S-cluster containining protein